MTLVYGWTYYFVIGGFNDANGEYALNITLVTPSSGSFPTLPLQGRYAHANASITDEIGECLRCLGFRQNGPYQLGFLGP